MDPNFNLLGTLLGNLSISPNIDLSKDSSGSIGSNNRLRNSTQINQIILNINGSEVLNLYPDIAHETIVHQPDTFKSGYHAVFLSNDQVYFGKLEVIGQKRFVKLKKIFYLKSDALEVNDGVANLDLVKLGQEIHGPEDVMNINTDHIVFWEKLKDNSPVVQAILRYENQHPNDLRYDV